MPLPGRFHAAIFDLDGLLIDSEPLWGRAEERLVVSRGGSFTRADRLATIGRSIDDTVAIHAARLGLAPDAAPELRAELIEQVRTLFATEVVERHGATELVTALTGRLRLAVASNSDPDLVALALATIGLAASFEVVVTAADVARPKPAPDVYLETCRRLGVEPSRVVGFEDSPAGVRAMRTAGVVAVGVRGGGPLDLSAADVVVDSLADVVGWVEARDRTADSAAI